MNEKNKDTDAFIKGLSGVPDDYSDATKSFYHRLGTNSQSKPIPINGIGFGILIAIGLLFWVAMRPVEWSLDNEYKDMASASTDGNGSVVDKEGSFFTHYVTETNRAYENKTGITSTSFLIKNRCVRYLASSEHLTEVQIHSFSNGKRRKIKKYIEKTHIAPLEGKKCRASTK